MRKIFVLMVLLSTILVSCFKSNSEPTKKQHLTNGMWTVTSYSINGTEYIDIFTNGLKMNFSQNGVYTIFVDGSPTIGTWSMDANDTLLELTDANVTTFFQVIVLESSNALLSSIGSSELVVIALIRP